MRTSKSVRPYTRRRLTPSETEGLNRELKTIESDRAGDIENIPHRMRGFIDRDVVANKNIMDSRERRIRKVLSDGAPDTLSSTERAKLEEDEKRLREKLSSKMITKKMMQLRPGSLDFSKARNALARNEMSAEFNREAAIWKNMRRQLDPEDPDISNLENIRPE